MKVETKKVHWYLVLGEWYEGYGKDTNPHFCGDTEEPCVTEYYQRVVTEWELMTLNFSGKSE